MADRGRPRSPDLLTPRQQEVLDYIRQGLTNAEISSHLGISIETVKQHVSEILSKLNVPTREAAAAWQPATHPFSLGRALIAAASLATLAAVVAGLGVLSWGVLRAGDGDDGVAGEPASQESSDPSPGLSFASPGPTPPDPQGTLTLWRFSFNTAENQSDQHWFTIHPDGSGLAQLELPVDDPTLNRDAGVPSPDGEWLAWEEGRGGLGYFGSLYVSRPDGTDRQAVASVVKSDAIGPCHALVDVAWSPDGSKLVYYSDDEGITVLNAGTWDIADQFPGTTASWSPDSTSLAATVDSPTGSGPNSCSVVVRDVSARTSRTLTSGIAPRWSPDGSKISFSRSSALHLISPDGSDVRRLIGYGDLPSPTVTPSGIRDVTVYSQWSPDASRLAATIDGNLLVIYATTQVVHVVAANGYRPLWSPDGNWLAFDVREPIPSATPNSSISVVTGDYVYVVAANRGTEPQRVTEGEIFAWR